MRMHVVEEHSAEINAVLHKEMGKSNLPKRPDDVWAIYKHALEIKAREETPVVDEVADRRLVEYTMQQYNDDMIKALICFNCACVKVDTGGIRSEIVFFRATLLFQKLEPGIFTKNYSMEIFNARYRTSGTALGLRDASLRNPDFEDWYLKLHESVFVGQCTPEIQALRGKRLLCCPEDRKCKDAHCAAGKTLCKQCEVPICRHCWREMKKRRVVDIGLINDNRYGYVDKLIYENEVTWMEKTVASPYWTSLMMFCIDVREEGKKGKRISLTTHCTKQMEEPHSEAKCSVRP